MTAAGKKAHVLSQGAGRTLVLVHGYLGGSAQWKTEVEAFSDRYHVVAVDLPGFGKNNHIASPTSIAGYAQAVLTMLDQLRVQNFDLLGHSMGGMVVQELVRIAPSRVGKLILYATGSQGALPGRFETLARSRDRLSEEGLAATAKRISATWVRDEEASPNARTLAEIALQANPEGAMAALWAMERWDGRDALRNITQETLVIWGELDRSYPWEQTNLFWHTIPRCSLAVVPNCAHAVHLDQPAVFHLLLDDFLRQ